MEKKDFLLLLGGIGLVILSILVWINKTNYQTAETTAIITSIGTGCGSSRTVVHFKYAVGGAPLENWTCYDQLQYTKAKFTVNSQAKACYDPSDPKDSSVVPVSWLCGD